MKIEKAIEIKTTYVEHLPLGVNEDWIKADKLSIEAMKAEQEARIGLNPDEYDLLPGETKE